MGILEGIFGGFIAMLIVWLVFKWLTAERR